MAKKVTRCGRCEDCAIEHHFGFSGDDRYVCTQTRREVSRDDGCTFGYPGKPGIAVERCEVTLSDDAAKHGYW